MEKPTTGVILKLQSLEGLIVERTKLEAARDSIGWHAVIKVGPDDTLIESRISHLDNEIKKIRTDIVAMWRLSNVC